MKRGASVLRQTFASALGSESWRSTGGPGALLALAFVLVLTGCGEERAREGVVPPRASSAKPALDATAPASSSPGVNLILITLDTTRADALGAYGQQQQASPHIDRLAAHGVLFEQVTTSAPETLPSHATLFTGKWPYVHGVRANSGYVLSERNLTLAEVLRDRGYRTGAEVAAPVLRKETLITQGFDHYRGAESPGVVLKEIKYTEGEERKVKKPMRVGSDISAKGIEFLRRNHEETFFLWLHYFDPHDPYSAPATFNAMFPDSRYLAEVASMDFQIGRVMEEVERLGLRDKTLVVLTADHGEGLYEHDEPTHSYFVYDSTMRVPLILSGLKRLPAGRRVPSLVRTLDIAPTALELMGLPGMEGIQGVSLMPLLDGGASDLSLVGYGESNRFLAAFGMSPLRFIRRGSWKYIHKVNPELYDVSADPAEIDNLITRHPDVAEKLRRELEGMIRRAPPKPTDAESVIDARTAAQLTALGYVAQSPAPDLGEEESLRLWGHDPVGVIQDSEDVSIAMGLIERKEFAQAMELLSPIREKYPEGRYVLELSATVLQGLERYREAAAAMREILKLEPCNERTRDQLRFLLREHEFYEELVALLAAAADHCPEALRNINNYAWALATLPSDALRDGAKAVRVIQDAIARLPEPDPAYLDTLAAALAETGEFDQAIETESQALELLRAAGAPEQVLEELGQHLDSYRARRPLRDPADAAQGM